jgi:hypothetical protein
LKYYFEVDLFFSLLTTHKGGCTSLPLKGKKIAPTSNGFGRIINLNYSFLLPLIRMGESLRRT